MKRTSIICFAILLLVSAAETALPQYDPGPPMKDLGSPGNLQFRGMTVFSPSDVARELFSDPRFVFTAHPEEGRTAFCNNLKNMVLRGYHEAGYLDAEVTVEISGNTIIITCSEGTPYTLADISITGLSPEMKQALMHTLTTPIPRLTGRNLEMEGITAEPFFTIGSSPGDPAFIYAKVIECFSFLGYFRPDFTSSINRHKEDNTADILINVSTPGQQAVISEIHISPVKRNMEKSILDCMNIKTGDKATGQLLNATEKRVAGTGRFMKFKLAYTPVPKTAGNVKLRVTAVENPRCSPLRRDLNRYEKTVLAAAENISSFRTGNRDMIIRLGFSWRKTPVTLTAVSSPGKGLCLTAESGPGMSGKIVYVSSEAFSGFISPSLKTVYRHGPLPFSLTASLGISANPAKAFSDFHISLRTSVSASAAGAGLIHLIPEIEPGAGIKILSFDDLSVHDKDGILYLSSGNPDTEFDFRLDMKTGDILKGEASTGNYSFSIDFRENEWDVISKQYIAPSTQYRNVFNASKPVSALFDFLLSECYYSCLTRTPAPVQEKAGLISWFDSAFAPYGQGVKMTFRIPKKGIADYICTEDGFKFLVRRIAGSLLAEIPDNSNFRAWPGHYLRGILYGVGLEKIPLVNEMKNIYADSHTGPLGFLLSARLSRSYHLGKPTVGLASAGYGRLTPELFKSEWSSLFPEGTRFHYRLCTILESIRNMNDDLQEKVVGIFPEEWSSAVNKVIIHLESNKDRKAEELLPELLQIMYRHALKESFQDEFLKYKPEEMKAPAHR